MTDNLKRCPFCGGEPKIFHHQNEWFGETWHIECLDDNCGCGTCHHDSKAIAVTVWNRRVPRGLQTEIDYLESEIEERDAKIERLRTALTEIRDLDVERSSDAWKRHSFKLKLIAREALGGTNG